MNILFISDRQALPTFGGIERVICNLARQFKSDNHHCYHVYFSLIDEKELPNPLFQDELLLKDDFQAKLEKLISEKRIDFVINNCIVKNDIKVIMPALQTVKKNTPETKFCFLYHNACARVETLHCSYSFFLRRFFCKSWKKIDVLNFFAKAIIFDTFPRITNRYFQKKYRRISENEPNLVFLSKYYKRNFAKIAGLKNIPAQWHAIGNSLCFDIKEEIELNKKENVVLLVARIEEDHKRISKALEIWEKIQVEKSNDFVNNWRFVLVGDGNDKRIYEDIVEKKHIPNVYFEGWKDSLPYYINASIFIMVSATEGFPMTLMEAKQCGCVPIAYDSFEAVHDVIEDNVDGYIVKNNDINSYVERLASLMKDDILRNTMAEKGMASAQKFSVDKIAQEWYNYYNQLK